MNPIAFDLFGHPVHWYGIMAGIGFLSAVFVMQRRRDYAQITEDQLINIAVWTMVAGILGARTYYVIANYSLFSDRPFWKIFAIWEGGLVYYGGFLLAGLFLFFYCMKQKLSVARITDLFSIGLPLGHFFGRIGCFLQGCCFGAPTDSFFGFSYPMTSCGSIHEKPVLNYADIVTRYPLQSIHPVQIYEAFGILLVFIILYRTLGRFKPGQTTALYFILYGVVRFITESFRGEYNAEQLTSIGGVNLMPGHIDSLFLVIPAGVIIWFLSARFARKAAEKNRV